MGGRKTRVTVGRRSERAASLDGNPTPWKVS